MRFARLCPGWNGVDRQMARKNEMETLVSKQAPQQGGKASKGTASAHKALITRNLRLAYGEVASEAVPDRFMKLLGELDNAEGKKQ